MPRGGPHASAATTGGGELGSRRAARLRRSRPLNEARSATVASTPGAPTRHTRHPLVATDVRRSPFPPTSPVPRSPPVAPVHTFPGLPPVGGVSGPARRPGGRAPLLASSRFGAAFDVLLRDPRLVQSRGRTTRWEWRRRGAEAMRPAVQGGFHGTYSHARRGARDGTSARAAMGREATLWLRAGRHACTRG